MREIAPNELEGSVIDMIGKEWMLVSAGSSEGYNTMTASWGAMGVLFNKSVAMIFIRPERYTYEFIEQHPQLTLTILKDGHRDALVYLGKNSGRDGDKIAASGLTPTFTPGGNPTFEQARVVLECSKLYSQRMSEDSFIDRTLLGKWFDEAHGALHQIYVVQIDRCWIAE